MFNPTILIAVIILWMKKCFSLTKFCPTKFCRLRNLKGTLYTILNIFSIPTLFYLQPFLIPILNLVKLMNFLITISQAVLLAVVPCIGCVR